MKLRNEITSFCFRCPRGCLILFFLLFSVPLSLSFPFFIFNLLLFFLFYLLFFVPFFLFYLLLLLLPP
jgi:hypothetical protein